MSPLSNSSVDNVDGDLGHVNQAFTSGLEDGSQQPPVSVIELKKQQYKVSENGKDVEEVKPWIKYQIIGAVLASLTQVTVGAIVGLPGVTLPSLTNPNSTDIYLDPVQAAFFGSSIHLGAILGSILSGVTNIYLGQRITLLMCMPGSLIFWLGMSFTPTVWLLQVFRFLLGVTQGFVGAASSTYVVEITHKNFRGRLTGMTDTGRQLGMLLVYIVGSQGLSWRNVMIVCGCITSVPPFLGFLFMPNSPRWLVTKNRQDEARKALVLFRGPDYDTESEFQTIVDQFQESTKRDKKYFDQIRQLCEASVLRRMLFLMFLMCVIQFSGNIPIVTYIVPIFEAARSDINSYTSAMLVGGIRVVGCITTMLLMDHVGRKKMGIIPCLVCALSLLVLGVYFLMHTLGQDVNQIRWLPLAALLVFSPFVCGIQSLTNLLRTELLPTSVRATGTAILYIFFFFWMYVATQIFPLMIETIGEYGTFWTYSCCCVLIALVIAIVLPEIRGLSLEQIDDLYRRRIPHSQENA